MAEENKNLTNEVSASAETNVEKKSKSKPVEKKPNFFVRTWAKLVKLFKDTSGELKKVAWTSKAEVIKNFALVIGTVVALAAFILVVDLASSYLINTVAGLLG